MCFRIAVERMVRISFDSNAGTSCKHRRSLNISDLVHDVEDVRIVINLDYPPQAEDYIHRIGRTARSGAKGTAYSFFTRENAKQAHELIQILKDSNQDVNEKLYEMTKMKHFGNGSSRGGGNYRGGFDRRGTMNNRHDDRAGNSYGGGARPTRFSNKRSRSRSPSSRPSRFDSRDSNGYGSHGNDYKRPRTDNPRSSNDESSRHPYSSSTNGSSSQSTSLKSQISSSGTAASSTNNPYSGFYNHIATYPPPASMYPAAYQMFAQASQQPALPTGAPPSS